MCALFDILLYGAMAVGLVAFTVTSIVAVWRWLTEPWA
jgi:hypothetical protein